MNLSDFIRGYANAASDELIEEMFDWFYNSNSVKTENPNRITRKDLQKWVPVGTPLYNKIQQVKFNMLDKYLSEFPYAYRGNLKLESEETKIQRTDTNGGGFHNFHAEQSHYKNARRVLAWTIYLNDIPDGEGETQFLLENVKVQPKKGMGCIFPASWMWQHRGNPVYTQSKYISTGWFLYPPEGKMD